MSTITPGNQPLPCCLHKFCLLFRAEPETESTVFNFTNNPPSLWPASRKFVPAANGTCGGKVKPPWLTLAKGMGGNAIFPPVRLQPPGTGSTRSTRRHPSRPKQHTINTYIYLRRGDESQLPLHYVGPSYVGQKVSKALHDANDALLGVHYITRITRPHFHCFSDPRFGGLSPTKLWVHPIKSDRSATTPPPHP